MPCRVKVRDARQLASSILPTVEDVRDHGACTLQEIADALSARGVVALRGGTWTPMQVWRLLRQAAKGELPKRR